MESGFIGNSGNGAVSQISAADISMVVGNAETNKLGMEKYENLGMVGEGSYGMVMKCRNKENNQIVAIKKFIESEDDRTVKKIAIREIRMLRQLRHENLVNLIEVFRRKKKLYLVFEFVDHTVLDELERWPKGLDENKCRKIIWQVLRGTEFCHSSNVIHRDIKPENVLVSRNGTVKLCDFGFARTITTNNEIYTEYVATRWYRAPELLVGDTNYGKPVDVWAIGCLLSEMLTGDPIFPGDSDIDQIYHITKCFGPLTHRLKEIFLKNPIFHRSKLVEPKHIEPLEKRHLKSSKEAVDFVRQTMRYEPTDRPSCAQLLRFQFFQKDGFSDNYPEELRRRIADENKALRDRQEDRRRKKLAAKELARSRANAIVPSTGGDDKHGSHFQNHKGLNTNGVLAYSKEPADPDSAEIIHKTKKKEGIMRPKSRLANKEKIKKLLEADNISDEIPEAILTTKARDRSPENSLSMPPISTGMMYSSSTTSVVIDDTNWKTPGYAEILSFQKPTPLSKTTPSYDYSPPIIKRKPEVTKFPNLRGVEKQLLVRKNQLGMPTVTNIDPFNGTLSVYHDEPKLKQKHSNSHFPNM